MPPAPRAPAVRRGGRRPRARRCMLRLLGRGTRARRDGDVRRRFRHAPGFVVPCRIGLFLPRSLFLSRACVRNVAQRQNTRVAVRLRERGVKFGRKRENGRKVAPASSVAMR